MNRPIELSVNIGIALTLVLLIAGKSHSAQNADEEFTLVVYNVENLFDADEIALYDDYKPENYRPADLATKLRNITTILTRFRSGKGPEIVLFQEFEADQSPGQRPFDYQSFLKQYSNTTVDKMLDGSPTPDVRDLPVEALLMKSLRDAGLDSYNVSVGQYRPDPTGRTVAHVNVTFSQFPIISSTTHQTDGARGIVETVHDINGSRLITLNNHWKSGASNLEDEKVRLGNAKVARERLDQLLAQDPSADIIIGGDFNSQYNQSKVNEQMKQTALNDVLGSQGNELAILKKGGPSLYNLWHELPLDKRGSDVYSDHWGTLMQIIVTPGLYDYNGVQYVDQSFGVAAFENVNAQAESRVPIAWKTVGGTGHGFSDHLPVYAKFRRVKENDKKRFLDLKNPGVDDAPTTLLPVDYTFAKNVHHRTARSLGSDQAIRKIENIGHLFFVEATVSGEKPFRVKILDEEYNVWSYNEKQRIKMYNRFPVGQPMNFLGELGIHKGKWQFIIRDPAWLDAKQ